MGYSFFIYKKSNYYESMRAKLNINYLNNFRLIDLYGWSQSIYNHITVCKPFVNKFFLHFFSNETWIFFSKGSSKSGYRRILAEPIWHAL